VVDWSTVMFLAWSLSDILDIESVEIWATALYDSVVRTTVLVSADRDDLDEVMGDKENVLIVVATNFSPIPLELVPFSHGVLTSSSLHLSLHQPQLSPRTST